MPVGVYCRKNRIGETHKKKGNAIEIIDENTIGIVIVRENGDRHIALLDKHLYYEKNLGSMNFYLSYGYARTTIQHPDGGKLKSGKNRRTSITLHHIILPREEGKEVDHKDGNPLNNRLDNLENVSHRENMQNQKKREGASSQYVGVRWWKTGYWRAVINSRHIGLFTCEEEAAKAYDKAVVKYRKIRVTERQLNFPENLEQYRQELRDDPNWPNKRKTSSRYKGVAWKKQMERWVSNIWINGKNKHLGLFTCEEEAAKAYDKAAVKYREIKDAENQLNFPENLEQYRQELRDEENISLWTSLAKEGDLQGLLFGGL